MIDDILAAPSPNHDSRGDIPIDLLLLHYTGMATGKAALDRMTDAAAKVSAHYMVEEDGRIFRLVQEDRRAWHAGVAYWAGATDINACSIGIELVNPGHEFGYRAFPEPQMRALEALAADIVARHAIPPHRVLGHSDVAPSRKQDPGELFDWARLASAGIGLWPDADFDVSPNAPHLEPGAKGGAVTELQIALGRFGYDVQGTGVFDPGTAAAVTAFQRHFRPSRVDGVADGETASLLLHLVGRMP